MKRETLQAILELRADGDASSLVTDLGTGDQQLVRLTELDAMAASQPELIGLIREAVAADRSAVHELGGQQIFVQVFNRPLRLVVVGAVHIAQALVPIALTTGFAVTVVDPRTAFASESRFPGTDLNHQWPDEAMRSLRPDHRTAVVTLSHDPKIDDPALLEAFRSEAFYIGSLGSRRTHAGRLERLRSQGVEEAALERIYAPVGLDIGSQTTAEIAVAIMAQIVQSLRRR